MYSISFQKVRSRGRRGAGPRPVRGYLFSRPSVGTPLVMFREDSGRRTVTTTVTRVMTMDRDIFVETENSLYRVTVHGRVIYRNRKAEFTPVHTAELQLPTVVSQGNASTA